jgi:hypothetical protein
MYSWMVSAVVLAINRANYYDDDDDDDDDSV